MPERTDHYACPKCEHVTYWRKIKGEDNVECVECGFKSTYKFLKNNEVIASGQGFSGDAMDIGKVGEKEFDAIEDATEKYVEGTIPAQGTVEAAKELMDQAEVERKIELVNKLDQEKEKDDIGWNLFTGAMKRRLATKRMEGRHGWWKEEVMSIDALKDKLYDNAGEATKDEMQIEALVDLGNYAMMLYNRLRGSVK